MIKRVLFISLSIIFASVAKGQSDFDLTQRWFNESLYNPAAVGNSFSSGLFLHGRKQWAGVDGTPTTFAGTFDTYIESIRSGVGVTFASDNIGITNSYNGRLAYAYYIGLGRRSALSLGLSAGLLVSNRRSGEADNPNDPILAYGNATEYSPDFDLGLEYKGPFKLGVAVRHLGTQSSSTNFPKHSMNIWTYLSSRFNVTNSMSLEPLASLTYRESVYRYEIGALFYFFKTQSKDTYNDRFWLGGVYRTDNNFAILAGMNITPQIRLGYSLDYGLGDISTLAKYGSHEIFIAFQFNRMFYKEQLCPAYKSYKK